MAWDCVQGGLGRAASLNALVCLPAWPQALRVSVGQLGITGRVKFHIVPEVPVHRCVWFRRLSQPLLLALVEGVASGGGRRCQLNKGKWQRKSSGSKNNP